MPRPDVDEVDLDPVDLGRELRQRAQSRLARASRTARPVAGERLHRRQLHALRSVWDELLGRPARRRDTPAQVVDLLLGNLELERPDIGRGVDGVAHDDLLSAATGSGRISVKKGSPAPARPQRGCGSPIETLCRRVTPQACSCALHIAPVETDRYFPKLTSSPRGRMTARSVERLVTHVGARGQVRKTSPSSTKPPGSDV